MLNSAFILSFYSRLKFSHASLTRAILFYFPSNSASFSARNLKYPLRGFIGFGGIRFKVKFIIKFIFQNGFVDKLLLHFSLLLYIDIDVRLKLILLYYNLMCKLNKYIF